MHRRAFLQSAATVAFAAASGNTLEAAGSSVPVVDAHIHLFDPTRPGGVPWPEKSDPTLYRPSLPQRFASLAQPHGVVGAIAIECSSWMVDNFWLLDMVDQNPIMLGFIGDLLPDASDFATTVDRLQKSPLFLGIRYGNLWNRDLGAAVEKPEFVAGLKLLAEAGLVLEAANPDAALIAAVMRVSDRVPNLRVVLDHLPHAELPHAASTRATYESNLGELAHRPGVFVKGSEIVRRVNGFVSLDVISYKAALDHLWDVFGDERIFFGSDWPNSDSLASYDDTFGVALKYISGRSMASQQKYFWKNSVAVYKWQPRTSAQKALRKP